MSIKKFLLLFISTIFLVNCIGDGSMVRSANVHDFSKDNIIMFSKLNDMNKVLIKKRTFYINFKNKKFNRDKRLFYSLKVSSYHNDSIFVPISINKKIENIEYFKDGSAYAYGKEGYEHLNIGDYGHHTLFYDTLNNEKTVFLTDFSNRYHNLSWKVNKIEIFNEKFKVNDYPYNELYLVLFNDFNLNNIIESGEIKRVIVQFK